MDDRISPSQRRELTRLDALAAFLGLLKSAFRRAVLFVVGFAVPLSVATGFAANIGNVVTFETLPDATTTPSDNAPLAIANEYELSNGVRLRFSLLDVPSGQFTDPGRFEEWGGVDSVSGFVSANGIRNDDSGRPDVNALLGNYFFRSQGDIGVRGGVVRMRIDYANNLGMHYASGEIWDIDSAEGGTEQWEVKAYNAANDLIGTQISPVGLTNDEGAATPDLWLDSRPWRFVLETHGEIDHVIIDFIGTKDNGLGLAFDNFTTAIVPEPTSAAAALTALALLVLSRNRRNR